MERNIVVALFTLTLVASSTGCVSVHKVAFPPADKLFITSGDDPASESHKKYTPKGHITIVKKCASIPLLFPFTLIQLNSASPDVVFEEEVIPRIKAMGGDALINARVTYTPENWLFKIIGICSEQTIVSGTVVKR